MSVDNTTDDDSSIEEKYDNDKDDEQEYDWIVESGEMNLAKVSYSTYEIRDNSLTVQFDDLREPDYEYNDKDAYELRDSSKTTGHFDPDKESVPDEIQMAFEVLAGEL